MRIEAVVTCVRYSDFLANTLPFNRTVFDHLVVVTTPEDFATQRVCEHYNVHCVPTSVFKEKGGSFNKGAGINAGLKVLSLSDWIVHLDADVVLPPKFRGLVGALKLDGRCIYGIDRVNCDSHAEWAKHLSDPFPQHEKDCLLHFGRFKPYARLVRSPFGGYVPIGYFQMWHPRTSGVREYPTEHTDAARGDVEFAVKWPRERRVLIPEVIAYHLESQACPMGANWGGRTTRKFEPEAAPEPVAAADDRPESFETRVIAESLATPDRDPYPPRPPMSVWLRLWLAFLRGEIRWPWSWRPYR